MYDKTFCDIAAAVKTLSSEYDIVSVTKRPGGEGLLDSYVVMICDTGQEDCYILYRATINPNDSVSLEYGRYDLSFHKAHQELAYKVKEMDAAREYHQRGGGLKGLDPHDSDVVESILTEYMDGLEDDDGLRSAALAIFYITANDAMSTTIDHMAGMIMKQKAIGPREIIAILAAHGTAHAMMEIETFCKDYSKANDLPIAGIFEAHK